MNYWDKPCADKGLISYRYRKDRGFIMIGALNDDDALNEANRSLSDEDANKKYLEFWSGEKYVSVSLD